MSSKGNGSDIANLADVGDPADSDAEVQVAVTNSSTKSPSVSKKSEKDGWQTCKYCCHKFPAVCMINKGTAEHPTWVDKQCHASSRWYDKALVSHGTAPNAQKRDDPKKYARHVFRFRIGCESDPPEVKAAFAAGDGEEEPNADGEETCRRPA